MTDSCSVFEYCLAGRADAVRPGDRLWNMQLSGKTDACPEKTISYTIGDYFLAAHKFLKNNNYKVLEKGLNHTLSYKVSAEEIVSIKICLEKHGPFYHPVKVSVVLKNKETVLFVLNGAVSDAGLATIENEYRYLKELSGDKCNKDKSVLKDFIPLVFAMDFIQSGSRKTGFFLAQWFDGFEEFHIVKTRNGNRTGILKDDGSFALISNSDAMIIYEKASKILTLCYGITTLKQIFPWHHAAGDFVVKIENSIVNVKLVTVRGYNILMESENIFLGLLFFFLNLTLRMRIDRDRGTKEYIFLADSVVKACVTGFISGLKENLAKDSNLNKEKDDFYNLFLEFMKSFDQKHFLNIFIMIMDSCNQETRETLIIKQNLEQHAKAVFLCLTRL